MLKDCQDNIALVCKGVIWRRRRWGYSYTLNDDGFHSIILLYLRSSFFSLVQFRIVVNGNVRAFSREFLSYHRPQAPSTGRYPFGQQDR
jgi:hypothetical protein